MQPVLHISRHPLSLLPEPSGAGSLYSYSSLGAASNEENPAVDYLLIL